MRARKRRRRRRRSRKRESQPPSRYREQPSTTLLRQALELFSMDLPNILNNKGPAASAEQLQQQLARAKGRTISEVGSGQAFAHNLSDDPSRFSSQSTGPQLHNLNMANAQRYTNSAPLQQQFPMIPDPYPTPTGSVENGYANSHHADDLRGNQLLGQPSQPGPTNQVKAFACSNCGKGFARRSDLARHGMMVIRSSRST